MNLLVRRRVLWDRLAGALWVLPTASVVVFLGAGALLSRVSVGDDSPLRALAFQGSGPAARRVAHVIVELSPLGLSLLHAALPHPVVLGDQIDQHP